MKPTWYLVGAFLVAAMAGCGGGGGGGGTAGGGGVPPTTSPTATPTPGVGTARFTIQDPLASTFGAGRRPANFSHAVAYILITIDGHSNQLALSTSSPQCTTTGTNIACAIDVPAASGPMTFSVQTLNSANVPLSTARGTAVISGTTTIPLALQGIWKTAVLRLANQHPTIGSPSVIPVTVNAYDAASAMIVGPEPYDRPIPLFDSDATGATSLSVSSVSGPGAAVTLSYDGHSNVDAAISGGVPPDQANGGQDTLSPAVTVVEYPIPSGKFASNYFGVGTLFPNADGSITFAEQGAIGRVTQAGAVTETPVEYYSALLKGPDGNTWALVHSCSSNCPAGGDYNTLERFDNAGVGTKLPMFAQLSYGPVTLGADGNFWMPASLSPDGATIQRVTPAGVSTEFAVPSNIDQLRGGVLGSDGNVWFLGWDLQNVSYVRVTPAGVVTIFPVSSADIGCCDAMAGDMALGPDGQVYAVVTEQILARMNAAATYSQLPMAYIGITSSAGQEIPNAMALGPDGAMWISTAGIPGACAPALERVATSGAYANLLLSVACDPFNGPAPQVNGMTSGPDGDLWYTRGTFVGKVVLH